MVKKFLLMFGVIIFLAGCGLTSEESALREILRQKSKTAAAVMLENNEWYMCRAASIGSIKDRYSVTPEKATAYNIICMTDPKFGPIFYVPPGYEL